MVFLYSYYVAARWLKKPNYKSAKKVTPDTFLFRNDKFFIIYVNIESFIYENTFIIHFEFHSFTVQIETLSYRDFDMLSSPL